MIRYAQHVVTGDDIEAVSAVLKYQPIARGEKIREFEQVFSGLHKAKHAIAVSSGTAALHLACLALGLKDKRVAVPSITFCGTANAVIMAGATPVYGDCGPDGNLLVNLPRVTSCDAAIPVWYAGNPCDMETLRNLMGDKPIILDACHALGMDGALNFAQIACYSFHPAKQITTGEGGMVTTNDDQIAFRLRSLRHNGIVDMYAGGAVRQNYWVSPGLNYWMGDIQAALGLSQVMRFFALREERRELVRRYYSNLPEWVLPSLSRDAVSCCAWAMFPVRIDSEAIGIPRNAVLVELLRRGIESQILYQPLHLQPMGGGKMGDLPGAEDFSEHNLCLPLHNALTESDISTVCAALRQIHG